jgi:hypothetical protein
MMSTEANGGKSASDAKLGAWLPIATAPRDRRRVLVWISDKSYTGPAFARLWFYGTDGRLGGGAEFFSGEWNITHWMPLPEAPNAGAVRLAKSQSAPAKS